MRGLSCGIACDISRPRPKEFHRLSMAIQPFRSKVPQSPTFAREALHWCSSATCSTAPSSSSRHRGPTRSPGPCCRGARKRRRSGSPQEASCSRRLRSGCCGRRRKGRAEAVRCAWRVVLAVCLLKYFQSKSRSIAMTTPLSGINDKKTGHTKSCTIGQRASTV